MSDTIKQPPVLAGDEGRDLRPEGRIERRIVWNLIDRLAAVGFAVVAVDDGGDEDVTCSDPIAAMEAVFAVDEARLHVRREGFDHHWIFLVGGNGEDIISDWSYTEGDPDGFNAAMDNFKPEEMW